jgi:hypothetical protein
MPLLLVVLHVLLSNNMSSAAMPPGGAANIDGSDECCPSPPARPAPSHRANHENDSFPSPGMMPTPPGVQVSGPRVQQETAMPAHATTTPITWGSLLHADASGAAAANGSDLRTANDSSGRGRGKHKRTASMNKRGKWIPHVLAHMESIPNIISTEHCNAACSAGCNVTSWATKRIAEMCAEQSFGTACLEGKFDVKLGLKKNHTACVDWFQMVKAFRVENASGVSIQYKVDSHVVCQATWAAFYGLLPSTSASMHTSVLKGVEAWNDGLAKAAITAHRQTKAVLTKAAAAWWCIRLEYYEMIVESSPPSIMHPASVVWKTVYSDEFVPEMQLLGLNWKAPDEKGESSDEKGEGSMSTWLRGRKEALKELAEEKLPSDTKYTAFKFVSRADHSAYVRCPLPFPSPP